MPDHETPITNSAPEEPPEVSADACEGTAPEVQESAKKSKKPHKKFTDRGIVPFFWVLVLLILGELLGSTLLIPITKTDHYAELDWLVTAVEYLGMIGIWIVTLLYMGITRKNRPLLKKLWNGEAGNNLKCLGLGLLIGFGMNGLCILVAWLCGDIHLYFDSFNLPGLIAVFIAVFIQSSAEELLCRGFLYERLRICYKKPAVAIVGNALLFGALHLFNEGVTVLSIINIVAVGILFSLMVYYMNSIWCAMAAHAAWNYTQNIIFGLPNSGIVVPFSILKLEASTARNSFAYNVGFGIEGTILADLVLILACVVFLLIFKKRKNTDKSLENAV